MPAFPSTSLSTSPGTIRRPNSVSLLDNKCISSCILVGEIWWKPQTGRPNQAVARQR